MWDRVLLSMISPSADRRILSALIRGKGRGAGRRFDRLWQESKVTDGRMYGLKPGDRSGDKRSVYWSGDKVLTPFVLWFVMAPTNDLTTTKLLVFACDKRRLPLLDT